MSEGKKHPILVDYSEPFLQELEIISKTAETTKKFSEKVFAERKLPITFNEQKNTYEWDEYEIRKFYENPENVSRTIFCREVNVDSTDEWGIYGFTPAFIFIKKTRYEGKKIMADEAAFLGLSIGIDPKTGLGVMNHFDYFPKFKFDYQLIRKSDLPDLFKVMVDVFNRKRIGEAQSQNRPALP